MFWDFAAGFYQIFEDIINGKVNRALCEAVAAQIQPQDIVLECACGTGMISKVIAPRCRHLTATDFSVGMLRQTKKTCAAFRNVTVKKADILHLKAPDHCFDAVVAGNVIRRQQSVSLRASASRTAGSSSRPISTKKQTAIPRRSSAC